MLYQVPSGSKSSGSALATGFAAWKALRFASSDHVPPAPTWITPFGTVGTPCEQPAPASSAYRCSPTNATLETPLTRLPSAALVWLDGNAPTTAETTPAGLILEIRPPRVTSPVLPRYGAAAPAACGQTPTVDVEPPRPPSAT